MEVFCGQIEAAMEEKMQDYKPTTTTGHGGREVLGAISNSGRENAFGLRFVSHSGQCYLLLETRNSLAAILIAVSWVASPLMMSDQMRVPKEKK